MKKNNLFLIVALAMFLFAVVSVSAKTSVPVSAITENVLENSLETNIPQRRYWMKITNNSRYDIYHLYVSSSENEDWGPDQFGDFVLQAGGGAFTLKDLIPGEYDIKFVDEDGDECVLEDIAIVQNKNWSLTTSWQTNCEGY